VTARRAAGAVIVAAALTATACTSSEDGSRVVPHPSPSPSPTHAEAPRRGGSIRVGVVGAPSTLDPYSVNASDLTYALARPIYPSLYTWSPGGTPEPSLARRVQQVPGGARVVLRRARWSDGSRVTSHDVVASLERARAPSGFARVRAARAVSARVVQFRGAPGDWERALATLTYVLPGGSPRPQGGGLVGGAAWRLVQYRAGLKAVFRRNRFTPLAQRPYLEKITVFFYESEVVLLDALRKGDVDLAVPPSTINLDARLEAMDVAFDTDYGWELVWLDLGRTLSRAERSAFVAGIDRDSLEYGVWRDGGRVSETLHPGPRGIEGPWRAGYGTRSKIRDDVTLSIPSGDELLFLLQRAIQIQLARRRIDVDLIVGSASDFYGPWRSASPADVALLRSAGAPGLRDRTRSHRAVTAFPLALVRTYLAWRPGLEGPEVNPTFDGPLWNMASWWLSRED
jgi:hypothetical protein